MKLIVQIPCFNEENTLPQTVKDIPRIIPGVDTVEILIIDDGSTDRTVEVAQMLGVDHIVRNKKNQGLARTFRTGLNACLDLGADIIVNTDGDNQYAGADIPKLVQPIIEGRAEIVVGDRRTELQPHFSRSKKALQKLGSAVVRRLSDVDVPDAVSGFRAISRDAALRLNIISPFSYTVEMLIQAGKKHLAVTSVPVGTNPKTRESRLFRSIPKFIGTLADHHGPHVSNVSAASRVCVDLGPTGAGGYGPYCAVAILLYDRRWLRAPAIAAAWRRSSHYRISHPRHRSCRRPYQFQPPFSGNDPGTGSAHGIEHEGQSRDA